MFTRGLASTVCTAKFSKITLVLVPQVTLISLVEIPVVSMPIAHSFKTGDICGIVLCDKTAHFRVAFLLSPAQGALHLCNDHAV